MRSWLLDGPDRENLRAVGADGAQQGRQMNDWNRQVIDEFRANQGKVAQFGDAPLVILHTIGAKSGQLREIPLVALDEDGVLTVFASKAGAPDNPDWYYNLVANPDVRIEVGTEELPVQATVAEEPERSQLYDKIAAKYDFFAEYARKVTTRVIPVIVLTRK